MMSMDCLGKANSVIVPVGVMRAMRLVTHSVNQRLPSGPNAMPRGWLPRTFKENCARRAVGAGGLEPQLASSRRLSDPRSRIRNTRMPNPRCVMLLCGGYQFRLCKSKFLIGDGGPDINRLVQAARGNARAVG